MNWVQIVEITCTTFLLLLLSPPELNKASRLISMRPLRQKRRYNHEIFQLSLPSRSELNSWHLIGRPTIAEFGLSYPEKVAHFFLPAKDPTSRRTTAATYRAFRISVTVRTALVAQHF